MFKNRRQLLFFCFVVLLLAISTVIGAFCGNAEAYGACL